MTTARARLLAIAITMLAVAGLFYLRLFNPLNSGIFPSCPFHALTGFYCPGCGSTRGLHQLLNGHFAAAFGYNPLMMLSLPVVGYAFASYALFGIRGRGLPRVFVPPVFIKLLFWIVIAFWILRNIPYYPFTLLAP